MRRITADLSAACGKIGALHGVNNGPRTGNFYVNTTEYFKEAGIPYSRLHDTEYAFGSGHYVDVHCIFPDEDADPADPANYDFAPTDAYLQAIRDAGTDIIYRLGASIEHGPVKCHVHPPKDFDRWAEVCAAIVRHYNAGWADGFAWDIRYWEIWNEPEGEEIGRKQMWTGTDEEYFRLYVTVSNRLKREFPDVKVGGYASCGFYAVNHPDSHESRKYMTRYADKFFTYITDAAHKAPLDFFSWHVYSGDTADYECHSAYVRRLLEKYGFPEAESILDEWNYAGQDMFEKMPTEEGAALFAAAMVLMQENGVSIAANYDGQPFLNYCAIFRHTDFKPTKAFYALKAWNALYRLGTQVRTSTEGERIWAAGASGENAAALVLSSYAGNNGEIPECCFEPVTVEFRGVPWEKSRVTVLGTDHDHTESLILGGEFSGDFSLTLPTDGFTVRLVKLEKA